MQRLIAPEQMRAAEQRFFDAGQARSIDIMERAAHALNDALIARVGIEHPVYIACGPGNNGGDGYALARLYRQAGGSAVVIAAAAPATPDAKENLDRARAAGVSVADLPALAQMPAPAAWVDALYGTGLNRAPEGDAARLIARIETDRAAGSYIISADIPSGLNGADGRACEPCVRADLTLALELGKTGLYLNDGLDCCGEIIVAPLGFPAEIFPENLPRRIEASDLRTLLPPRRRNIHKNDCGHLLLIVGSVGMAGAAAMAARAALRAGVGLVTIACPAEIVPILQTLAPQAMALPLKQENGAIAQEAVAQIEAALAGKTTFAVGCGLTRRVPEELIVLLLRCGLPGAFDADALNLIAAHPALCTLLNERHVLTPHPGEAARLLGRTCANPLTDARELAAGGATVVIKGASRAIVSADEAYISAAGTAGMARGGAGDIYTGILGALLAEDSPRTRAQSAAAACELHGLAGEIAQERFGARAMNAMDIIDALPEAFKRYVD